MAVEGCCWGRGQGWGPVAAAAGAVGVDAAGGRPAGGLSSEEGDGGLVCAVG